MNSDATTIPPGSLGAALGGVCCQSLEHLPSTPPLVCRENDHGRLNNAMTKDKEGGERVKTASQQITTTTKKDDGSTKFPFWVRFGHAPLMMVPT
jgi:hypothetical protein